MTNALVSVIVPTRFQRLDYLEEALQSIREQQVDVEILLGIDRDGTSPEGFTARHGVVICRGAENSQAAALNAALSEARGKYVAFLEDDDRWLPNFLTTALNVHEPFVSSTQLEVDADGRTLKENDFPTPSGWLVEKEAFNRIGPFVGRWHLDNYILGRAAEEGVSRVHLVEAGVALQWEELARIRPELLTVLQQGGTTLRLQKHAHPSPLVLRRRHPESGVSRILASETLQAESRFELAALLKRFGRIPW